jgi:flavin reductase (DIM6/NTAB) family NADH-FMN oxidoreductase RutF
MDSAFKKINPDEVSDNPFELVADDWMLVTAGPPDAFNTMTAGWGGFGILWRKNVCWCVIRPVRYTYEFIEKADSFTLSFFADRYRSALEICGSRSGRDCDKVAEAKLTPIPGDLPDTTTFAEARLIFECRKIYTHDLDPARFLDPAIDQNYPQKDYHRMYVGEIINCWVRGK